MNIFDQGMQLCKKDSKHQIIHSLQAWFYMITLRDVIIFRDANDYSIESETM